MSRPALAFRPEHAHGYAEGVADEHFEKKRQAGQRGAPAEAEKEHLEEIDLPGGDADAAHEGVQPSGKLAVFEEMERENADGDVIKAGVDVGVEPIGGQRPVEAEKFERGDIAKAEQGAESDEAQAHAAAIKVEVKAEGGDEKIADKEQAVEIARDVDGADEPFIGHIDDEGG